MEVRSKWSSIFPYIFLFRNFFKREVENNYPSTLGNNWTWRMAEGSLSSELANKIYRLTKIYGRCE